MQRGRGGQGAVSTGLRGVALSVTVCSADEAYDLPMVVDEVTVRALTSLPEGIDRLLRTSLDEVLVEARVGDRLVGVGGLNRDPYVDDSRVGRIRHLYASPEVRGRGVGRKIVVALVDHARGDFSRVRLRTTTEDAARFYTELGFQVADEPDATHVLGL